jgi:SWI/SNF-related matrix-associated actin-dependent regulator of chromatin subfamily A3
MRFHGSQKRKTLSLSRYDIVITTFETLVRQLKRHENPKCIEDTLFSFSWHRIVLDEGKSATLLPQNAADNIAHTIRNRKTAMARACCAIHATNRWAITGTPIQNRPTDFASLLEFLKMEPFSNPKVFDQEIAKPWLRPGNGDVTKLKKLVNCMSLCRTKAIIDLPPRVDEIHNLDFSPEEQEFYDKAKEGTIQKVELALASNPLKAGQYLNALQWLNELRLLCNHGLAQPARHKKKTLEIEPQDTQTWNKSTANKAFETILVDGDAACAVCDNVVSQVAGRVSTSETRRPFLSKCLTLTCGSCVKDSPKGQMVPTCHHNPLCKIVEVSWGSEFAAQTSVERKLPVIRPEHVSTKLKTLLKSLQNCPEGEKRCYF